MLHAADTLVPLNLLAELGRLLLELFLLRVEGVDVISVDKALEMDGWVIGGGEIYKLFLPHVSELHRTIIDARVAEADTHFPDITGMGFTLKEESHVSAGERDEFDMIFQHWTRN